MKKILGVIAVVTIITFIGCKKTNEKNPNQPLFDITFTEEPQVTKLSQLFPDARLVKLETNDSSLVGARNMKVILRDGVFYIRSLNEIIMFDADGNYLDKLSHHGGGPGEYERIADFDVVDNNGHKEVWIANYGMILRYDAETKKHIADIKPQFSNSNTSIWNMSYVNDSSILVTSNDELWIKVLDTDGNVRHEFMNIDFANSGESPVAFRRHGNLVYCPIIETNTVAVYYIDADTLGLRPIINPNEKFVTMKDHTDAYESQGMMGFGRYIRENFITFHGLANHGNDVLITFATPEGKQYLGVSKGGETKFYTFDEGATLENDLVPTADTWYPVTNIASQNDNGFILIMEGDEDENPYLLTIE